jgi:DHA2 family multidrug resistance protein
MGNHAPYRGVALALITIALSLATFMQVLDTSIANVSLPTIAGDLGVSPQQGTWVITSFAVSNAIMLPLTGWLSRRFGEVRLFVFATLLFALASWACGMSFTLPMLLTFRVIQGAVAGPMIPLSQTLLLSNYPPEKKGMALALWSMTVVVAPICGPIFGGWISDNIGWPWIFYINVPVGLIAAYVTWMMLKDRESERAKVPVDGIGLGLLIVGVGCLQVMLDKGNELDWFSSNEIVTLTVIATIALVFFIVWELTDKHPVVDLTLFAQRNFAIGTIAITLGYLLFFSNAVIYPLWLQRMVGYTSTWAGLAIAPIGILPIVLSPVVGRTINKVDARVYVSIGFLVFGVVAYWTSHFNLQWDFEQLAMPRFVQGIGVAFFFVPLTAILLSKLPPQRIAAAAGLSNFLRMLGAGFGTSLSVTFWDRRQALHYSQLTESVTPYSHTTTDALNHMQALGLNQHSALAYIAHDILNQAYTMSINDFYWISAIAFVVLMVIVWFARPPFISRGTGGAH